MSINSVTTISIIMIITTSSGGSSNVVMSSIAISKTRALREAEAAEGVGPARPHARAADPRRR